MTDSDFSAKWVAELRSFAERINGSKSFSGDADLEVGPVLDVPKVAALEATLGRPLPIELRDFLLHGTASLQFSFEVSIEDGDDDIQGGIELDSESLAGLATDKKSWMDETWIADDEDELARWAASFPFCHLSSGDMLGVVTEGEDQGCVIYLSHDSESQILSRSFLEFLREWAQCCYLGPEIWMLEPYLNPDTGLLDGNSAEATEMRHLLQG